MQYSYTVDGYDIYVDEYNQPYWWDDQYQEWVAYQPTRKDQAGQTTMEQLGFNSEQYEKLGDSTKALMQTLIDNGVTDPATIQSVVRGLPQLASPMLGPVPGGVIISYIPVLPFIIAYIVCLVLIIIILFNLGNWWYVGKLLLGGLIALGVAYGLREILALIPPIGDRYNARRIPARIALSTAGVLDNIPLIGTVWKFIRKPYDGLLWIATL